MAGRVHPYSAMFLREYLATTNRDSTGYDICRVWGSSTPLVYSHQTKQYFSLPWSDIVELAIKAGIDIPLPEQKIEA